MRRHILSFVASVAALSGCELFSPPPAASPAAPPALPAPSASKEAPPPVAEPPPSVEPAPEPPPPPGLEAQGSAQTRGRLPRAAIQEGVQQAMPAIEACYLKAVKRKPGVRGRVLVNFVIAPDGSVPYAASLEQGTDFPDDAAVDCVLKAFQSLRFPEPTGGRVVATYPLTLEPAPETGAPEAPNK